MGRFQLAEKEIVSAEKEKKIFDEQMLAKLLEAAYVLQEHNRELRDVELGLSLKKDQVAFERSPAPSASAASPPIKEPLPDPPADYTFTLAKIVETQHQIQLRHLDLAHAMSLVADRLTSIARAGGTSVGFLTGKKVRYHAVSGEMTLPAETEVPMDKALCIACLRTGQVMRCTDVNAEFLLDPDECRRRDIQSLIAVPVFHNGEVAGGIEVYYPTPQAFTEHDVHSCQLMAGLVTEALSREQEISSKKSLATERAVMLEALEKLKPNLASLVEPAAPREPSVKMPGPEKILAAAVYICRKCGHGLVGPEQFCGNCGTPRESAPEPMSREAEDLQSKVAALWHTQESPEKKASVAAEKSNSGTEQNRAEDSRSEMALADSIEEEAPELFGMTRPRPERKTVNAKAANAEPAAELEFSLQKAPSPASQPEIDAEEKEDESESSEKTALVKSEADGTWKSAASARDFLEQLAEAKRSGGLIEFWNNRRGDIYLAIAVILVACVIRWGIWSNHSTNATAAPPAVPSADGQTNAAPDLSPFDRLLISLGLADPPKAPEKKGNPETKVWVDTHSALYYCPGADLYGKTPKGKLMPQREAQLDQYQPAYRQPCD